MEIAGEGGSDERFFSVLVIIPCDFADEIVSKVHGYVGHWLVVVVGKRSQGLQDVKLRSLPANAGYAIAQLCTPLRKRLECDGGQAIVSVVVISSIYQQRIIAVIEPVSFATAGVRDSRQCCRRVVKADKGTLEVVCIVVGKVDPEPVAWWSQGSGKAIVAIVTAVSRENVVVRGVPQIH